MSRSRKPIPHGFVAGDLVRVSSNGLKGFELGIVHGACKYDEGIIVQIADIKKEGVAHYECIDPARQGETIVRITREA